MYRIFVLTLVAIYLMACVPGPNPAERVPLESTPAITEPGCQPSLVQKSKSGFPEIQGTMNSEGELWALLFFDTAHAKEELKIVWRITGTDSAFTIQAEHEDGTIIVPIWGPASHGSSTWDRPGKEWGTGFNFPEPGCWTLNATLGETKGQIILNVLPSQPS
jgi:hypothetical protein